ncbi:hypothetical protein KCU89_g126, partial [Aureobasidium melanogenum]
MFRETIFFTSLVTDQDLFEHLTRYPKLRQRVFDTARTSHRGPPNCIFCYIAFITMPLCDPSDSQCGKARLTNFALGSEALAFEDTNSRTGPYLQSLPVLTGTTCEFSLCICCCAAMHRLYQAMLHGANGDRYLPRKTWSGLNRPKITYTVIAAQTHNRKLQST